MLIVPCPRCNRDVDFETRSNFISHGEVSYEDAVHLDGDWQECECGHTVVLHAPKELVKMVVA